MRLRSFDAARDAAAVLRLWEAALGDRYPIQATTFLQRTAGNPNYRPGDGLVATVGRRIVGFGLVEVVRSGGGPADAEGHIAALMVDPESRRQGLGRAILGALEAHLRALGCAKAALGRGPARFWTGLPEDLPEAAALVARCGYSTRGRVCDLVVPLCNYAASMRYQDRLQAAGAEVVSATPALLPALLDFEYREFPGWAYRLLSAMACQRQM